MGIEPSPCGFTDKKNTLLPAGCVGYYSWRMLGDISNFLILQACSKIEPLGGKQGYLGRDGEMLGYWEVCVCVVGGGWIGGYRSQLW